MNCQRFDQVVSELARGQMMEADVRTEALAHSEECGDCRGRLRDEETLTRGLRLLAGEMESMSAPDEMELRLRKAFRSRQVPSPVVAKSSVASRYWLAAVAAALLVVMGVAAMWWRSAAPQGQSAANQPAPKQVEAPSSPSEAPSKQSTAQESTPQEATPKAVEYSAEDRTPRRQLQTPRAIHRNNLGRRAPEMPVANHVTNEIATDFMPLGDMNLVSLQDGGQIVRVKLRRSTLARFGFPVNMDRYNENVKADVLVGADGLARAIRFVQ